MPELPEIESIRRALAPQIRGRRIRGAEVLWAGAVRTPSVEAFCRLLAGRTVEAVDRRGKYLLFRLVGGGVLIWF